MYMYLLIIIFILNIIACSDVDTYKDWFINQNHANNEIQKHDKQIICYV